MKILRLLPAALAVGAGAWLVAPAPAPGFSTIGGALGLTQRDVRVYDNFADPQANDNAAPEPSFPGHTGAELAIWKATVEWGSELHGDGQGDPHQLGDLGSGGANFDAVWQSNATGIGGINDNVHSAIGGQNGGVLAYCETPIANGWRIRYYDSWTWDDGPGDPESGAMDLQGVATHEYGHALGLGHSGVVGATMYPTVSGAGVAQRSIEPDDAAGVQAIYGIKSATKPRITQVVVDSAAGTATISGVNFSAVGNEVWFTNAAPTAPEADPIVKVTGIASSQNGSLIIVALPAEAGPGDVLVKIAGTGHAALSNAWPLDPQGQGSPYGPPTISGVSPSSVAAVAVGSNVITITGTGFAGLTETRIDGVVVDPLLVNVLDDTSVTVDVPLQNAVGALPLELTNAFGTSAPGAVNVVANDPPVVALDSPFLFSASGMKIAAGAPEGHRLYLAGSLLLAPTVIPGVLSADIGGGTSVVLLGGGPVPTHAWIGFDVPLAPGLPFGTQIHLQAAVLDPAVGPPYATSNVATGTFYF